MNSKSSSFTKASVVDGSAGESNKNRKFDRNPKAWYSRNYLPHCDVPGLVQMITYRLVDALPKEVLVRLAAEKNPAKKREKIEAWLDRGQGVCWLRDPRCAVIVEQALHYFDGQHYRLLAWCVMPNHVHVL